MGPAQKGPNRSMGPNGPGPNESKSEVVVFAGRKPPEATRGGSTTWRAFWPTFWPTLVDVLVFMVHPAKLPYLSAGPQGWSSYV